MVRGKSVPISIFKTWMLKAPSHPLTFAFNNWPYTKMVKSTSALIRVNSPSISPLYYNFQISHLLYLLNEKVNIAICLEDQSISALADQSRLVCIKAHALSLDTSHLCCRNSSLINFADCNCRNMGWGERFVKKYSSKPFRSLKVKAITGNQWSSAHQSYTLPMKALLEGQNMAACLTSVFSSVFRMELSPSLNL